MKQRTFRFLVFLIVSLLSTSAKAALITSAADPALAGSTLIDFDSEPTGNFASKTLSGVTFSTSSGFLRNASAAEGGTFGGSGQDLSTLNLAFPYSFRIDFSSPVSAFGMVWGAANPDWTVNLFNSSGVNIETLTFVGGNNGATFVEFYGATNTDIKFVTLQSAGGSDWLKIDNFQFVSQAQVPEPASLLLFGIGLSSVAGRAWRRQRH